MGDEDRLVVAVNVTVRCPECKGTGDARTASRPYRCMTCKGEGHQNVNMPIENFARLFTWGQTYSSDGTRGPRHDIRVAEPESEG